MMRVRRSWGVSFFSPPPNPPLLLASFEMGVEELQGVEEQTVEWGERRRCPSSLPESAVPRSALTNLTHSQWMP